MAEGHLDPQLWSGALDQLRRAVAHTTSHCDTTSLSSLTQFQAQLDLLDVTQEVMIITDEKWRLPDRVTGHCAWEQAIVTHPRLQHRPVLVVTHGYHHRQFGPMHWVVSYPSFFLQHCTAAAHGLDRARNLPRGFSSLNHRPALHRLYLGYRLHQAGLLPEVIFSLGAESPGIWRPATQDWPDWDRFTQLLPMEFHDHLCNDHTVDHPAYHEAYCNIVTETETEWDHTTQPQPYEIITEKSYKPFLAGQIPLFLAAPGHMAYLERLGFEVMWDLVPPGYDLMSTQDKVQAIVALVARGPGWIEEFYWAHQAEIQHNWHRIRSGQVQLQLIQEIQQLTGLGHAQNT